MRGMNNQPIAQPSGVPGPLDQAQLERFRRDGFCVAEALLPPQHLALLRDQCQAAIDQLHAEMDRLGTDTLGIAHRGRRYFAAQPSLRDAALYDFIYSPLMAAVCRQLLGNEVHVFFEQYVVKAGERGDGFAWHQDSAYVSHAHPPYLTCWVALDDMTQENGTISVLPFGRAPLRGALEPHRQDPVLNDLVGYAGDDPGELVLCPAGSVAFFSSLTLHRSGVNRTPRQRRVYLIQYSGEVIRRPDGTPWERSEVFLRDGQVVGERRTAAAG